jgi:hypothetical protein
MGASVADRDRAVRTLQKSFIEGRLAPDEFEHRVGRALVSRDFRELLALTADLPVRGPFDRLAGPPDRPAAAGSRQVSLVLTGGSPTKPA